MLKENDFFRVRFLEVGTFKYNCQIYTRMKGSISVIATSNYHAYAVQTPSTKNINKSSQAAPTMVQRTSKPVDTETCLFKTQKSDQDLNRKLIEVLEDEENLSIES
jgi:hypothetical protein